MVFLKYFLLNFLFLFSEKMGFANVAIFSLISLIFVLIVEIKENIYYSLALSVIFLIIIYYFPEFLVFHLFMQFTANQYTISQYSSCF